MSERNHYLKDAKDSWYIKDADDSDFTFVDRDTLTEIAENEIPMLKVRRILVESSKEIKPKFITDNPEFRFLFRSSE